MNTPKRQTAQKVWISMLHQGSYVKQLGEYDPNFIQYNGMDIARVNIIGTIVAKYVGDNTAYVALTLDDGSGSIRLKAWKEDALVLEKFKPGDLVLVVGKPREYNEEIYISPEIVKKTEPNYELVRKLELIHLHGKSNVVLARAIPATIAQPPPMSQYVEEKVLVKKT